jgi:hypothetical protein
MLRNDDVSINQLTYSREESRSSEADSVSPDQELHLFHGSQRFITVFIRTANDPILSQINPVQTLNATV